MKFTFDIDQDCIDKGEKKDPERCPIALAIDRLPGLSKSLVGEDDNRFEFDYNNTRWEGALPPIAQTFIEEFDKGNLVSPITFEVEVFEKYYDDGDE